jgi:hypothetical protein
MTMNSVSWLLFPQHSGTEWVTLAVTVPFL